MKIHEYNEMMSYLTRPAQPTINRNNFAIGGGAIEGEDLGTREGFRKPKPKDQSPETQQKRIENFETITGEKYEKQTTGKKFDIRSGYWTGKGRGAIFKSKEFIEARDKNSKNEKFRNWLRKQIKNAPPGTIPDIESYSKAVKKAKTGHSGTAEISRIMNEPEFAGKITSKFNEEKIKNPQTGKKSEILRKHLDKIANKDGSAKIINVSEEVRASGITGNIDSGRFYEIVKNDPRFEISGSADGGMQKLTQERVKNFAAALDDYQFLADTQPQSDLAKIVYGSDSVENLKKVSADASNYVKFLLGTEKIKGLKLPSVKERADIVSELLDENNFSYESGVVRQRMMKIRDGLLGQSNLFDQARKKFKGLSRKGKNLDEIAGMSATYEKAPGYTEFVQLLGKKLNQKDKRNKIDLPFSRIFENVVTGKKQDFYTYKGKQYDTLEEVVDLYNADATKFEQSKGIKTPKILYRPGEKLNVGDFVPNFKYLTPESQKDVKRLAKQGIGIEMGDAKPIIQQIIESPKFQNNVDRLRKAGQLTGETLDIIKDLRKLNVPGATQKIQKLFKSAPKDLFSGLEQEQRVLLASLDNQSGTMTDVYTGPKIPVQSEEMKQDPFPYEAALPTGLLFGRYAKPLLSAFGSLPASLYFAGSTIKEGMDKGKSFVDAATEPEVGLELLYPEIFKRAGLKIFNPIIRASTPTGIGITTGGILKNRAQEMMRQAEGITALPAGEAQNRLIEEYAAKNYRGYAYANGGRIGFADGPEDPSKRKFMKIMGGLASLPILGRFIKVGEQAPAVLEAAKGVPEWFGTLVDKVIKTGVDATKRFATKDREEVFEKFIGEQEGVRVYRDLETGDTRVEYFSPDNMGGDSVDLVYKAPEELVDGTIVPGEFKAVELEPRGIRMGPDDYDIEFDGENVVESVDDLMSDTSRLEEFATGKSIDLDKAKIAKEKRNKVGKLNEDTMEQAEYLETKYGPGDEGSPYYQDFSDYD